MDTRARPGINSRTVIWHVTATSARTTSFAAIVARTHGHPDRASQRRTRGWSEQNGQNPTYAVGQWVWVCNTADMIRQGAKKDTDGKVLEAKLSTGWGRTKLWLLDLPRRQTRRMGARWRPNSYFRISLETCLARLDAACFGGAVQALLQSTRSPQRAEISPGWMDPMVFEQLRIQFSSVPSDGRVTFPFR